MDEQCFKGRVSCPTAVGVSKVEEGKDSEHGRHAAQLNYGIEGPNFVALLLGLQCGSRLPCPTLADEWRSLADVDDCWRVGLLQQTTAQFASVACLEPRAHLNGATETSPNPHAGQSAGCDLLKADAADTAFSSLSCRLLRPAPAHARHCTLL